MFFKFSRSWMSILEYNFTKGLRFSTESRSNWDLVSSVCLERKPIITKELTELELKVSELLNMTEFELSYKSNHEVQIIKDKLFSEELKKQSSLVDRDDVSGLQTAQEFEDASINELKSFTFGNRVSVKNIENDVKSSARLLGDSLVLVTKINIGNQSKWVLPQVLHQKGESMRDTAERALSEVCGNNIQARFLGNSPCGFYKFRYPKTVMNNNIGMKIFFFKAQLIKGSVSEEVCEDFKWLSSKELHLLQEDYLKSVRSFLIENE